MQVQHLSKQGQCTGAMVKSKLTAAVKGTKYAKLNANHSWERLHDLLQEDINQTNESQQETIQNEWTKFSKVNEWCNHNKGTLIKPGLAEDKEYILPDGTVSEISIHDDCMQRMINWDETDHSFTTHMYKGGSCATRWGSKNLPKGSEQKHYHTTRVHRSNDAGGVMPPVFFLTVGHQPLTSFNSNYCGARVGQR